MSADSPADSSAERRSPQQPPRVSVIIPTYNRERYLREAIDSVLDQTLSQLELIVIDDGSTDATQALLESIHDERLRYITQPNRGLSAALNRGLQNAHGEYIARLDSDDVYMRDTLSTLTMALEASPEVDVVWARGQFMNQRGVPQPRTAGSPEHFQGEMLRSLLYEDCTIGGATLFRKSCLTQVGPYDEGLRFSEDWDMVLRLARHFRFRFVDKVVIRIREHDETMTRLNSRTRSEFLNTRTLPLDKLFSDPQLPAEVVGIKPIAYANVHIFCGRMWISTRNFWRALLEFERALVVSRAPFQTACAIVWRVGIVQILERSSMGRRMLGNDRLLTNSQS